MEASGDRIEVSREYPRIGQAIALLIALLVLLIFMGFLLNQFFGERVGMAGVVAIANVVSFAVILMWGMRRARKSPGEVFRFSSFPIIALLPLVLVLFGLEIICSEIDNVTRWILPVPDSLAEILMDLLEGSGTSLICLVVVAPLTEELLFRGLILSGFLGNYSARKAILVSAVLFSLFHISPYQLCSTFLIGVLLGWLFVRTRSLWPCILAHSFVNGSIFIFGGLNIDIPGFSGDLEAIYKSPTVQFQPLWFDLTGCLLLGAGLILLRSVLRPRTPH